MVENGRPLKRMKRRVTADLYDFLTFPAAGEGFSYQLDGPFRSNVKLFLSTHARLPPPAALFPYLLTWQILFRIGDLTDGQDSSPVIVALDVVEEDVTRSRSVYCDQCRVVGWSGHPVCGKRYHFIIRAASNSNDGYQKSCPCCGDTMYLSDARCKSCNYMMTTGDLEEWVHLQLGDTSHLLHGVVHSNGYGHLLRVNGREGGSKFLSGCEIMDFWDRLCKTLAVRKVSVMDVSKKYGLEYRLLHAVTNGRPWYGDWGYEFGAGSFALTLDSYQEAVNHLSKMPLSHILTQSRSPRTHLQDVISFYQSISEYELSTIRDLFCFLTKLIHNTHGGRSGSSSQKQETCTSRILCAWTQDDIERVVHAMIKVLRAAGHSRWITWRTLRGAVCKAAPPELLSYCLKELEGKRAYGGMIVRARRNPDTNATEYRLEPFNDDSSSSSNYLREEHLLGDLIFLYDSLLNPRTMCDKTRELAISSASKLLDSKQFVKDYKPNEIHLNPFAIRLSCQVDVVDQPEDYTVPPPELLMLPLDATVADLKIEATKAFQEVYVLFKRFQAEDLLGFGIIEDHSSVKVLVGSSGLVRVKGRCLDQHGLHEFRMERGTENWIVDCICGTKDDDGERMMACDTCGVWQHTRCAGVNDYEMAPAEFVCGRCSTNKETMSNENSKAIKKCKDETVVSECVGFGGNMTILPPFDVR